MSKTISIKNTAKIYTKKQNSTLKKYKNIKQINEHFFIVTAFLKIFKLQRRISVKMSVRKMFETESNKQRMTRWRICFVLKCIKNI